VRVALGAGTRSVASLVLRDATLLAVIGIAIGAVGAALIGGTLRHMLFGVSPLDPVTFGLLALVLLVIALLAGVVPAYRAARSDPMMALRSE
jgi:putative ABC transport system permease protein